MNHRPKKIDFYPAAEAVCEECGKVFYFSLVMRDSLTKEEAEAFGLDQEKVAKDKKTMKILLTPKVVTCQHCGARYKT